MNRYTDQAESYKGQSLKKLAIELLKSKTADAVFIPFKNEYSPVPMPSLVTDPEKTDGMDPLAPVAPFNSAKQAASVLKHPTGRKTALFLRPCELRALIELVKLNQCSLENALIISFECLGRIENSEYGKLSADNKDLTKDFYLNKDLQGKITATCASCTAFTPLNADIEVNLLGTESTVFSGATDKGEEILANLSAAVGSELSLSKGASIDAKESEDLLNERAKNKEKLFSETGETIKDVELFQKMIGTCLNCYNCRTACPVCYCKECVFLTDVFLHDPDLLHQRSVKKGVLKLPSDTTMFHMTRLSHISHSCVGCGQCTSVCPSDIQVADIFRTVSEKNQEIMEYKPGSDPNQPVPYLAYKEVEKHG